MAFNFKTDGAQLKDPKQKRLLVVAVVVFAAAGVLYWRLFFVGPELPTPPRTADVAAEGFRATSAGAPGEGAPGSLVPAKPQVTSEEALKRVRLDTNVVKTQLFQELRLYGEYPITIPEKGNPSPFERAKPALPSPTAEPAE